MGVRSLHVVRHKFSYSHIEYDVNLQILEGEFTYPHSFFSPQRRVNHGSCKAEMMLEVIVMTSHKLMRLPLSPTTGAQVPCPYS